MYWTVYRHLSRGLAPDSLVELNRRLDADPVEEAKRIQREKDEAFLAALGWTVDKLDQVMVANRGK